MGMQSFAVSVPAFFLLFVLKKSPMWLCGQ
jgi:hypothetical protein